jgi:hypothetical protein
VQSRLIGLVSGQYESAAIGILTAGAVMALGGGVRMALLNEDMPTYHRVLMNWEGRRQTTQRRPSPRGFLSEWLTERNLEGVTWHAGHAAASCWSRVRRWQAGMATGPSVWLLSLAVLIFYQVTTWMMSPTEQPAGFVLLLPLLSPVMSLLPSSRRFATLGRELLTPVDRGAYLRQLGAAMAICQFHLWAAMAGVLVAWRLLTASEPVAPGPLAYGLAISILGQVWIFAIYVWLTRYRSQLRIALGFFLSLTFAQPLVFLPGLSAGMGPIALAVAGVLATLGLLVTWDAYRRWLVTELG